MTDQYRAFDVYTNIAIWDFKKSDNQVIVSWNEIGWHIHGYLMNILYFKFPYYICIVMSHLIGLEKNLSGTTFGVGNWCVL